MLTRRVMAGFLREGVPSGAPAVALAVGRVKSRSLSVVTGGETWAQFAGHRGALKPCCSLDLKLGIKGSVSHVTSAI